MEVRWLQLSAKEATANTAAMGFFNLFLILKDVKCLWWALFGHKVLTVRFPHSHSGGGGVLSGPSVKG